MKTRESKATKLARARLRENLPEEEWEAVDTWSRTFFAFQREWLWDFSRFTLVSKARQIGISHTIAGDAAIWGMLGETTTIISKGQREADEVLDKASKHLRVLEKLGSAWARSHKSGENIETETGGRIIALPSTSGGRSFSGNVILDEFAYLQDPKGVWDAAAAVVLHGYRLKVMSTPNGVGNLWHDLWTNPKAHKGYRRHEVTIDQAREDGMVVDDSECWKMARGDPRVYDQLFRCKFLDGEAQYIPTAAIMAQSVDSNLYSTDGDCFAGLDIGRTSDRTDLVIVKRDDGVFRQQHSESCKRTSSDDLVRLAAKAFGPPFYCRRLCVDATGLGSFPADDMRKQFGRHRVEPVVFSLQVKEDIATTLYLLLTEGRLWLDPKDEQLRDDLCAIRRIITSAGNVRYDAPVTEKGHADRAWALGLACHAGSGPDRRRYVQAPSDTLDADRPLSETFD